MPQEKISSVIRDRVPRFIIDEYPNFVEFLDAYNRFLEADRTVKVSLEEFVSILDYVTVLDTDMNQIVLPIDITSVSAGKVIDDVVFSNDSDFYLINGKRLDEVVGTSDSILSREIGMLFSEGPYLVNIADYVDPSYLLVSPLVTDEFAITDITRGVVETILALDSISKNPEKYPADSSVALDTLLPFLTELGKSDQSIISDLAALSSNKPLADSSILLDVAAKTLSTNRSDFLSAIADTITSKTNNLQKTDSQSFVDAIVEKIASTLYQETTEALENFSIEEYASTQELANASENIQSIGIGKQVFDVTSQTDSIQLEIINVYQDEILSSESISISLNSAFVETGDYMGAVDYVPENYFGGSIDDNLTAT